MWQDIQEQAWVDGASEEPQMRVIVVVLAVVFLVGCCPGRVNLTDQAYRDGKLTFYEYQQLKFQETMVEEAETANALRLINSGWKRR